MQPDEQRQQFETTRWSLVHAAHDPSDSQIAHKALSELCEMYWYPLYAYARRQGSQVADAQEQVQEFLTGLLTGSFFEKADASKGRFRSFLLKSFSHFLSDRNRFAKAARRGGDCLHFSIDATEGEGRYQVVPADQETPDRLFERQWALTLLDAAMSRLRQEYQASGKADLLERLLPRLSQESDARPYTQIAESLAMNETAVKVAAYRMRKRYRTILRAEIADTLQGRTESEIDEELHWLIATVSGSRH